VNAHALPQLDGRPMVTDGGMETDLIFHHGVDLPLFAADRVLRGVRGDRPAGRRAGAGLTSRPSGTSRPARSHLP